MKQIQVKWHSHESKFPKLCDDIFRSEHFLDTTLSCQGQMIKAHRLILSAFSPYFHKIFVENPCPHPVVIMRDFQFCDVRALVDYMYRGCVNVDADGFREFLQTAQSLQVRGLSDNDDDQEGGTQLRAVQQQSTYTCRQQRNPPNRPLTTPRQKPRAQHAMSKPTPTPQYHPTPALKRKR